MKETTMEPTKKLQTLLEETTKGNFQQVLCDIKQSSIDITTKYAVKFVISCYKACLKQENASVKPVDFDDLCELLAFVEDFIKDPTEEYLNNYLYSVYHIINEISSKKRFKTILKLRGAILPHFLPEILTDQQKKVLNSIGNLLYNIVVKHWNGGQGASGLQEVLLGFSYLVCTLHSKYSNANTLFDIAYNCALCFTPLVASDEVEQFYFFVLKLKEEGKKMEELSDKIFSSYLTLFACVFDNFLKEYQWDRAQNFFDNAIMYHDKLFVSSNHKELLEIMEFCLVLSPTRNGRNKEKTLKHCIKNLTHLQKREETLRAVILKKLLSIRPIVLYYKNVDGKLWKTVPLNMQENVYNFLHETGSMCAQVKADCPCKCSVGFNILAHINFSVLFLNLLKITIKDQPYPPDNFKLEMCEYLKHTLENIVHMKKHHCENWKSAWSDLGVAIYNLATILFHQLDPVSCSYYQIFIKYYLLLQGNSNDVDPPLNVDLLRTACSCICELQLKLKDYLKCMAWTALNVYLRSTNSDPSMFSCWLKSKVHLRENKVQSDEIQQLTLVAALDKFKGYFNQICGYDLQMSQEKKIELLFFELEQYKLRWKSKVPMMSAFKELYSVADIETTMDVIVKIFGDGDLQLHDEMPKLFLEILQKYESVKQAKCRTSKIYLAIMYHFRYRFSVKDAIVGQCKEMEHAREICKSPDQPNDDESKDPTEQCDIVSSYEALKLNKQLLIMNHLHQALQLISAALADGCAKLKSVHLDVLFKVLMKIALEYRLHMHNVFSLQALLLALKIANHQSSAKDSLQAMSFIIESGDVQRNYVRDLIGQADGIVKELEQTEETLKIILIYYISKTKAYLYNDYKLAYSIFNEALQLFNGCNNKDNFGVIEAQLLVLHFKFVKMPCEFDIIDHKAHTIAKVYAANQLVIEVAQKLGSDCSYEMSVVLDVNEELVKFCHQMRMPREVRCYCKDITLLVQKLLLPLRCANCLIYLAFADMKTNRLDDCQVKLNGINDILCLPKYKVLIKEEEKDDEKEVISLTNKMQKVVLDVPQGISFTKPAFSGSPVLFVPMVQMPSFLQHSEFCDCFYCTWIEYHRCLLAKVHGEVMINLQLNNRSLAHEFFNGGFKLYETLKRNFDCYRTKIVQLVSADLVYDFQDTFLEVYGWFLLDYCTHQMRTGALPSALETNEGLIRMLLSRQLEHSYLYNEAMVQRLDCLSMLPKSPQHAEMDTLDSSDDETSSDISTTPESRSSQVTIKLHKYSPELLPPNKRVFKQQSLFTHSADDDERAVCEGATSKIKIYTQNESKSCKKKGKVQDVEFLMPEMSVTGTPTVVATPSKMEMRIRASTKQLTKKLKQNSLCKKPPSITFDDSSCTDNAEIKSKGSSVAPKDPLRKNLLNDFSTGEQSGSKSGIRKSARNLK